jgi:phosphoribosyl 1,2-cyclic phosphate phosphodiesterase
MKLTFLGTGTSQGIPVIGSNHPVCHSKNPKDKRLRTAAMIEHKGFTYVIDCGPDFRQQMLRENVQRLDAILLTHEHNDHIIGLDDIRPFYFQQEKNIDIYATLRVQGCVKKAFSYFFEDQKYPGTPGVSFHEINDTPFYINNLEIIPIKVEHYTFPVTGFRMGDLCYITDANHISEEEKEKIKGTKVLVLNALRKTPHYSHFTLDEAVSLAKELKVERCYFTHISNLLGFHDEVNSELPKNMQLAYDGLSVQV